MVLKLALNEEDFGLSVPIITEQPSFIIEMGVVVPSLKVSYMVGVSPVTLDFKDFGD